MATVIRGTVVAKAMRAQMAETIARAVSAGHRAPALAVVQVEGNASSDIYVGAKLKACKQIGMDSLKRYLPADASQSVVNDTIAELNEDSNVDGILVQLPLPEGIDEFAATQLVSPGKDVDGFHAISQGMLLLGNSNHFRPCTPAGIMNLIDETKQEIRGKEAVIIGASHVGRPMAIELLDRQATVTVTDEFTKDLRSHVERAEILIAAAGVPHLVKADWVREGSTIIDVGINRLDDGKIVGDVEFDGASKKAGFITPVPGGVGPMTVAMLLHNTLLSFMRSHNFK